MLNFRKSIVVLIFLGLSVFVTSCKEQKSNTQKFKIHVSDEINNDILIQFSKELQSGSFFENESGFDFLISDTHFYFITTELGAVQDKIMIHFLKSDGSFINNSFQFEDNEILNLPCSSVSLLSLKVASVKLPIVKYTDRIRIGQYNEDGNIWYRILNLQQIKNNKLLKYNNIYHDCLTIN